jgi:hypothetical protein
MKTDPLLKMPPDRLRYSTGELLGADDFEVEQTYHRRQLSRALLHLHGSGSVVGLRVLTEHKPEAGPNKEDEVELVVEPGIAIDRAGRLIELSIKACLRLNRWFKYISDPRRTDSQDRTKQNQIAELRAALRPEGEIVADVFLSFHPCEREKKPAFATGPFDELDASQPSRLRDCWQLSLLVRAKDDPLKRAFDPWMKIAGAGAADRLISAKAASLDAWKDLAVREDDFQNSWEEYPPATDCTAVLLARVRLPAAPPIDNSKAPELNFAAAVWALNRVDNDVRNYVFPSAALRRIAAV